MTTVGPGSHVTLHYRLSVLADGAERDVINTFDARPATVQIGAGQLAPSLEERLLGLAEGERRDFELEAGAAFGQRSADLVQTLARAAFDANADPATDYQPGDVVEFNAPDGRRFGGVLKSRDRQSVVVDFNHPLAGMPLRFQVHVIGVL
ncbi:MAG TPA: FKBP-type peptidyl-prolyl cis-trans isomerase [Burkholderiaceae bacterium]|nr:FKBP-type peptidyl-prolyl cis-trans isomerase [Burkholderiaceae bacterium]